MKELFNLEFEVLFVVNCEKKIEPFLQRSFSDLLFADDFEKRLKFILPLLKDLFGCDFSYSRLNKVVFGTKGNSDNGAKDNCR